MDTGYRDLPRVNREIKKLQNDRKAFERARAKYNDDHWFFSNVNGIDKMIEERIAKRTEIESRGWRMFNDGTAVRD
jgi:hypothetical protein